MYIAKYYAFPLAWDVLFTKNTVFAFDNMFLETHFSCPTVAKSVNKNNWKINVPGRIKKFKFKR